MSKKTWQDRAEEMASNERAQINFQRTILKKIFVRPVESFEQLVQRYCEAAFYEKQKGFEPTAACLDVVNRYVAGQSSYQDVRNHWGLRQDATVNKRIVKCLETINKPAIHAA